MARSHHRKKSIPPVTKVVIAVCILLSLVELIPYGVTVLFPNLCYGCTAVGKLHQNLNAALNLSYVTWMAYLLLFVYCIYRSSQWKNTVLKIASITVCLFMIYVAGYPLLNLISLFFNVVFKNPPFLKDCHALFPSAVAIEDHADDIISEFKAYTKKFKTDCIRKVNPAFKLEISREEEKCWRAVYLKKTGEVNRAMEPFFPTTLPLLEDAQIHNAFFSILDPGVEIPEHVGYYKGYLRYHLGILIPNSDTGGVDDKAYIVCGGEKYFWKEKKGIVFDDMYSHYVKNPTDQQRVVLYLDVKRRNESSIENSVLLQYYLKNQHNQTKIKNV